MAARADRCKSRHAPSPATRQDGLKPTGRPRVLFGCTGWPSGLLEVASWARHRDLAKVVIFQLQPGRVFRLDPLDRDYLGEGLVDPKLVASFARHRRPLSEDSLLRRTDSHTRRTRPRLVGEEGTLDPAVGEALVTMGGGFILKLIDFDPHVVGFRLEGGDLEDVKGFISVVRMFSNAEVVLGGPTPTSHPKEVLADSGADYVFAGEAEETFAQFLELARQPNSKCFQSEIPGLAFRHADQIYHNTLPGDGYEQTALDEDGRSTGRRRRYLPGAVRPVADVELIAANRLDWSLMDSFVREFDSLFFTGGRGCPGRCTFCARLHGDEVRIKSAEQLLEEIEAADAKVVDGSVRVARWDLFKHVDDPVLSRQEVAWAAIYDEDFFLRRRRALEFFRLWDRSPLSKRYRIGVQTNPRSLLDAQGRVCAELLQWIDRLKPMIQLGAESFNPELLARWHKRHTVEQLGVVLDALDGTRQDYAIFILLSDFDTTPEELVETLGLLVLGALGRRRMRIASSPLTIPLYDSDIRRSLEYGGLLPPERIGHFSDYERPQPGWLDPLAAELADLADSQLRWTLDLPHRDSALLQSLEAVLERIRREEEMVLENRASSEAQIRRVRRLHDQARLAVERVKNVRFSPISPPRP